MIRDEKEQIADIWNPSRSDEFYRIMHILIVKYLYLIVILLVLQIKLCNGKIVWSATDVTSGELFFFCEIDNNCIDLLWIDNSYCSNKWKKKTLLAMKITFSGISLRVIFYLITIFSLRLTLLKLVYICTYITHFFRD